MRWVALARPLAGYYVRWAEHYGLRADVLWAQMALETGDLAYGGQVRPSQNNFCGLKTTDGGGFASFPSVEAGVKAHVEHMAWYANPECVPGCGENDPRHLGPHGSNGWVEVVADLSGKWSTSERYAENLVARAGTLGL